MADIIHSIEQELSKATYSLMVAKEQLKMLEAALEAMRHKSVVHVKNSDE